MSVKWGLYGEAPAGRDPRTDVALAGEIVEANLGLIGTITKRHFPAFPMYGAEWDDVLQLGRVGLLRAVRQFDPARGVAFNSFAGWCVRGSVSCGLRLYSYETAAKRQHLNGRHAQKPIAIDEQLFADKGVAWPGAAAALSEDLARVRACLTAKQWDVLWRRASGQTLDTVGAAYGVSRERIRHWERDARLRAREVLTGVLTPPSQRRKAS